MYYRADGGRHGYACAAFSSSGPASRCTWAEFGLLGADSSTCSCVASSGWQGRDVGSRQHLRASSIWKICRGGACFAHALLPQQKQYGSAAVAAAGTSPVSAD